MIDEADELLQADWEQEFKHLMAGGGKFGADALSPTQCSSDPVSDHMTVADMNEDSDHRYLMFSASFNKECRQLARTYLSRDHIRVRISRPGSVVRHIQQIVCVDHDGDDTDS